MIFKGITNRLEKRFTTEQFTYKELRNMFFPLVMDQLFIFIINMLSSAMVSSSKQGAAAAVGLVSVIGNLAYAVFNAAVMGGSILVARAKGANDPERVRTAIGHAMSVSFMLALSLTVVLYIFSEPVIRLFYSAAEEDVILTASEYMKIYVLSFPVYTLFNVIFNSFRSIGDSKSSLILTIVINSVHLIFSYLFINVIGLATVGAAYSYLAARGLGLAFALVWLFRRKSGIFMKARHFFRFDKSMLRDIGVLGVPFAFEQMLFQGGMLLMQMYLARLTTVELDAYNISVSIFFLYYAFAYSMTTMAGTVCGQCVGAKKMELARTYCKNLVWVGRYVMIFAILILMPLTPAIMNLYSPAAGMRKVIFFSLAIGALPMPLIWGEGYVIPSATRTAGDVTFTSVFSLATMAIGRMAFGYLFTIPLGFGVMGVWMGQFIEWLIRAVVMTKRLDTDKWIRVSRQ